MSARMITIIAAAAASFGLCAQQTPPVEFKGTKINEPHQLAATGRYRCIQANHELGDEWCTLNAATRETIAGAAANSVMVMSYGGVVKRILIDINSSAYTQVRDAMEEKYGPPSSVTVEPWQSRGGAKTSSSVATWTRPDGMITIKERASRIDAGYVQFESLDAESLFIARKKQKAPANSKDM